MEIGIGDKVRYRKVSWSVVDSEGDSCLLIADKCLAESQFYENSLTFKDHWTASDYEAEERVSNDWEVSEIPSILKRLSLEEAFLLTKEEYDKWKDRIPPVNSSWWLRDGKGRKDAFVVEKDGSTRTVSVGVWFYGVRPVMRTALIEIEREKQQREAEEQREAERKQKEEAERLRFAEERKRILAQYWKGQGEFGIGESKRAGKVVFFADRHWVILGEREDSYLCLSYEAVVSCPFTRRKELGEDGWSGSDVQTLCRSFVDVPEAKVLLDDPYGEKLKSKEKCFLLSKSLYTRFREVIPKTCGVWWLSTSSLRGTGEQLCVDDREDGVILTSSCERELGLRVACFIPKTEVTYGWNATFLESFQEVDCYLLNEVILCDGSKFALHVPEEGGALKNSMLEWCARTFGKKAGVANMTVWQYQRYQDQIPDVGRKWLLTDFVDGFLYYVKAVGGVEGEEVQGLRPMIFKKRSE